MGVGKAEGRNAQTTITNKAFKGWALSTASSFVLVDNDALHNPLLGLTATVSGNCRATMQKIESTDKN